MDYLTWWWAGVSSSVAGITLAILAGIAVGVLLLRRRLYLKMRKMSPYNRRVTGTCLPPVLLILTGAGLLWPSVQVLIPEFWHNGQGELNSLTLTTLPVHEAAWQTVLYRESVLPVAIPEQTPVLLRGTLTLQALQSDADNMKEGGNDNPLLRHSDAERQ